MKATKPTTQMAPEIARWQLYLCCLLLVACTIPWRRGTYFSGALDPVVAAKGVLGGAGLALAFFMSRRSRRHTVVGARTLTLAALYLVVSCLGGWAAGQALASVVVAVRVAMLLTSLALLLHAVGVTRLITTMIRSMGAVAFFAVATGAGTVGSGRLQGGVPPLTPNEVALLTGALLLLTVQRMIESQAARWEPVLAIGLFGVVWLTGSRTTAATLFLGVGVMVIQARRFSVAGFVAMVAAIPAMAYAVLATSAVTNLLLRGGDQNVTTLASRTIAWKAALTMEGSTWQRWFGGGLPMKHIPVSGQFWQTQLLDSSWISALVQTGLIGLTLTAVWTLAALGSAFRTPRPWRPLWVGLVAFVGLRSLLESGLFDASTSFILFAMVSLMSERATRHAPDPGATPRPGTPTTTDDDRIVVSDDALRELQLQGQRDARSSRTTLTARR